MRIVDLAPEHVPLYCVCLEDWNAELAEAGDHKARWYDHYRDKGLRVKLALADDGTVGGMIQYLPVEHTGVQGENLYVVQCIWVHGHKQGRGDFRHRGMGRALLAAAEEDARALGADGMVTWGLTIPVFMRASWFKRRGYRPVDRVDLFQVLLWKPFREGAKPPRWLRLHKRPAAVADRVQVTALLNGWCTAGGMTVERTRRACARFGDAVRFELIDTKDPAVRAEWGTTDAVFIDGKLLRTGPPPSYEKIEKKIRKAVKRKRLAGV